jgi:hypothetical protein
VKDRLSGWFNTSAFCAPPAINPDGTPTTLAACPTCATLFGNSGVGIIGGPDQFNWDITLMKNTPIRERQTIQFRAEFFNLFNHAQFDTPGSFPGSLNQVNVPNTQGTAKAPRAFGPITNVSVNPRVIQLALKYSF